MPSYERTYNSILHEARTIYENELLPEVVFKMYVEFADMLERVVTDFKGGKITEDRATLLKRSISSRLHDLGRRLNISGDGAMVEAAELAVSAHEEALVEVGRMSGVTLNVSLAEVPYLALENMYARRGLGLSSSFKTLINRHLGYMASDVDRFLTSAVARGVSGRRGGQNLAKLLSRNDPALLKVLGHLGPRGGRTRAAIKAGIEISGDELKKAKSLLFDSYRIMVHETNMAYSEADTYASAISSVVDLLRWKLSGRHMSVPSSPDVCDIYAEGDLHGLGKGLFTPENVPTLPHPFCLCRTSKVLRPPSDWYEPKRDPARPHVMSNSHARKIFDRSAKAHRKRARTITTKHIERQLGMANQGLQQAHDVLRKSEATIG